MTPEQQLPTRVASNKGTTHSASVAGWTLPASILAGSIIAGAFSPILLLISLATLLWLSAIHRSYSQTVAGHDRIELESARKLSDAATLSSRLSSILESADVPILATNQRGSIVHFNAAAQSILGSGRSLLGDYFDALITQRSIRELELHAREGEPGHARLELPIGGDMRTFDVAADPIPLTGGAVCTFTDITELSRSATLKADFAANASHELRTPIAAIIGAIQTLDGPAKSDPEMSKHLTEMISNNANRLDLLVNDLLDLSKLESTGVPTQPAIIDMHELIEKSSAPFQAICERRSLKIATKIDTNAEIIVSDRTLVELIMRNLIGNATKFAHQDTTIDVTIDAADIPVSAESLDIQPQAHSMGVRVRIRDRGIGIPLSQQSRIFERFYQVDEGRDGASTQRGTGLGLAIVKHAARTLGGTIELDSIHGQGTTMILELPNTRSQTSDPKPTNESE